MLSHKLVDGDSSKNEAKIKAKKLIIYAKTMINKKILIVVFYIIKLIDYLLIYIENIHLASKF